MVATTVVQKSLYAKLLLTAGCRPMRKNWGVNWQSRTRKCWIKLQEVNMQ